MFRRLLQTKSSLRTIPRLSTPSLLTQRHFTASARRLFEFPEEVPREELEEQAVTIVNPQKDDKGRLLRLFVSDRAADRLNAISADDENPLLALRIEVESGGCHGFQYKLELSDVEDVDFEMDSVFEKNGARVLIDKSSLEILRESNIDYTTELIGSQFKVVDSPYTVSACGCGSSFDFDESKLA
ncbi:Iron-sulfur cluster assembly 2-like protein [Yarrowia sp. C11]|nr:Iron-sulfur cluster assembly 2-like protein [Yarrowia sp. C11]KAG5371173.1 Iron-sulfur cluster assembly 2-like protein [Yarrowia sp. E02]